LQRTLRQLEAERIQRRRSTGTVRSRAN
jgi:hypothetical protein